MTSKIEWTDETWNPVTGCTKISEGCKNCWAERMAKRLAGRFGYPKDEPFGVTIHRDSFDQPLKWKKPRRIFVCSMGDLFHEEAIPYVGSVLRTMCRAPQHTFLILTKRPGKMREFFGACIHQGVIPSIPPWIWLGVTAENQKRADKRIPILLQIPAAVRFVSIEPMLGPVDLTEHYSRADRSTNLLTGVPYDWDYGSPMPDDREDHVDWVIVGGESGPGSRPMHPGWARSVRDQCLEAGVPFFFKQWGEWSPYVSKPPGTKGRFCLVGPNAMVEIDGIYQYVEIDSYPRSFESFDHCVFERIGKKAAGRILDGKTWEEFPA